jgi:large subunit ribosomal protein L29
MIKAKELAGKSKEELENQVVELKQELAKEKATIASGTKSENPGKIRKIRRDIARCLTFLKQKEGVGNARNR